MKQNKKEQKNNKTFKEIFVPIIVLVLVATIAGAILGVVNMFTQIDKEAVYQKNISKIFKSVYQEEKIELKDVEGFDVNTYQQFVKNGAVSSLKKVEMNGRTNDIYVFKAQGKGAYGGTVELFVIVDDNKIKHIDISSSKETPGIGSKVLDQSYLQKYYGRDISNKKEIKLVKNSAQENQVDATSGATKTSTGVNNVVNAVIRVFGEVVVK